MLCQPRERMGTKFNQKIFAKQIKTVALSTNELVNSEIARQFPIDVLKQVKTANTRWAERPTTRRFGKLESGTKCVNLQWCHMKGFVGLQDLVT